MSDEALGVSQVGDVGEELEGFDELDSDFLSSFDAEADDGAEAVFEVLPSILMVSVDGESGVVYP